MAKTYNDIYIDARRALKDAGIEAYALEARLIVACVSGKTTEKLLKDLNLYAGEDLVQKVRACVERRLQGEPVAYITGSWEFYGVPLYVNSSVLIPRPDTEIMARAAISLFAGRKSHPRILDLCTGSGCIGCAMALHMPAARIVMADNDPDALAVARENLQRCRLAPRVMCVQADVYDKPPILMGEFDLITCNAPYIPSDELMTLDRSVRDYEPIHALDGGEDGLNVIRAVISGWKSVLKDDGTIMLEVGEGQAEEVCRLLREAGFARTGCLKDTAGTDRIVVGTLLPGAAEAETETEE